MGGNHEEPFAETEKEQPRDFMCVGEDAWANFEVFLLEDVKREDKGIRCSPAPSRNGDVASVNGISKTSVGMSKFCYLRIVVVSGSSCKSRRNYKHNSLHAPA